MKIFKRLMNYVKPKFRVDKDRLINTDNKLRKTKCLDSYNRIIILDPLLDPSDSIAKYDTK